MEIRSAERAPRSEEQIATGPTLILDLTLSVELETSTQNHYLLIQRRAIFISSRLLLRRARPIQERRCASTLTATRDLKGAATTWGRMKSNDRTCSQAP